MEEEIQIPIKTRRGAKTSYKARYECLMDWKEERKIVCKPPRDAKQDKREALKFELDILTKPFKIKQQWLNKQPRRN